LADVGYLAVTLRSPTTSETKFAVAGVSSGSATAVFPGLTAGNWQIRASLYDWNGAAVGTPWSGSTNPAQPSLLFVSADTVSIVPATSTPVTLLAYRPGDLSTGAVAEGDPAVSLSVADGQGLTSSDIQAGTSLPLFATPLDAQGNTPSINAVYWTSDRPDLAQVNNAGVVTALNVGTAVITAHLAAGTAGGTPLTASYTLVVDPAIVGHWRVAPVEGATFWLTISSDSLGNLTWVMITPSSRYSPLIRGVVQADGTLFPTDIYNFFGSPGWQSFSGPTQAVPTPTPVVTNVVARIVNPSTPVYRVSALPTGDLELDTTWSNYHFATGTRIANYVPVTSLGSVTPSDSPTVHAQFQYQAAVNPSQASIPNLFWVADPASSSVSIDPLSGITTFTNSVDTTIRAFSLDNPSVTQSLPVSVSAVLGAQVLPLETVLVDQSGAYASYHANQGLTAGVYRAISSNTSGTDQSWNWYLDGQLVTTGTSSPVNNEGDLSLNILDYDGHGTALGLGTHTLVAEVVGPGGVRYTNDEVDAPMTFTVDTVVPPPQDTWTASGQEQTWLYGTSSQSGSTNQNTVQLLYNNGQYYGEGASETWTFQATATQSQVLQFNWVYSGFHSYYNATTNLSFVLDGVAYPLVPTQGTWGSFQFNSSAPASFAVKAGQTYGFKVTGYSYDYYGYNALNGAVTITYVP
jgi:hypothetical protein